MPAVLCQQKEEEKHTHANSSFKWLSTTQERSIPVHRKHQTTTILSVVSLRFASNNKNPSYYRENKTRHIEGLGTTKRR